MKEFGEIKMQIKQVNATCQQQVVTFLEQCLPESGRKLDLENRYRQYSNIEQNFVAFWALFDDEKIIGTVAISRIDDRMCELKALYLYQKYQGNGYGRKLLLHALGEAKRYGFKEICLDTLSTSSRAIALYQNIGFYETECYNNNKFADLFMRRSL